MKKDAAILLKFGFSNHFIDRLMYLIDPCCGASGETTGTVSPPVTECCETLFKIITGSYIIQQEDNGGVLVYNRTVGPSAPIYFWTLPSGLSEDFKVTIIQAGGEKVMLADDGISVIHNHHNRDTTDGQWDVLHIQTAAQDTFVIDGDRSIQGGSADTMGLYKFIDLQFDGTAGKGAVGSYTLPVAFELPQGSIIDEVFVKVTVPMVSAGAAYINFGIATDGEEAALDSGTGDMIQLNANVITKIITPDITKIAIDVRDFVMAVGDTAITDGMITIIIKTITF